MLAIGVHALAGPAWADTDINSGSTYQSSNLGSSVNPDFKGGTLQISASGTISNNFAVENYGGNTIDANGRQVTMSGVFTGAGGLTFMDSAGGGVVTLTSDGNTYSGATTVNSGATLALSGSGTLASSSSVAAFGTFDISASSGSTIVSLAGSGLVNLGAQSLTLSSASGSFSGVISGTGSLTLTAGTQTLSGANTYTGGTTITSGTLQIGAGDVTGSIVGNVVDNGTLAFNRSDSITYGGTVTGKGNLVQSGAGTLTLTGVNGYTGATTISAGTLALAAGSSISASSGVTNNGVFDISATGGVAIKSLSGNGTVLLGSQSLTLIAASGSFSGTITGSGSIIINGGTEIFAGVSDYTGTTTINAGTLKVAMGTVTFNVVNNGTFGFESGSAVSMSGVITGPGAVSQTGTGTTTITVAQNYSGVTTISAGTLALSGSGSIANSSGITMTGGVFNISNAAGGTTINSLAGTGNVQLGGQYLTFSNATGNFSGVISGTGGLIINGGNETLSGTNTFTGATTITAGSLILTRIDALATSSSVVNNGTLDISAASNAAGSFNVSITSLGGTGTVALGNRTLFLTSAGDAFSGVISGTGSVNVSGGVQALSGKNSYTGATVISAGTLVLSGNGSIASSSKVTATGTFDISTTATATATISTLDGSGSVLLGDRSLIIANGASVFSGVISGSGGLTLTGGSQVLTGVNTYTGGTTITAGTLVIGQGTTSGSISGNVVDNSAIAFYRSDSQVFTGVISGSGRLVQQGTGTTILTSANTYTGGTTISAGTLQIGNGTASGSISGDVVDNGTLAFGRSDQSTFSGAISGIGGVRTLSGTVTLTAVNSYSGTTLVDAASTLILSGSGSIANSSVTTVNGTFDVSANAAPRIQSLSGSGSVLLGSQSLTLTNAAGTFAGVISGSGSIALTAGTQTLAGVSTYTGATSVTGGTLAITGNITSSSGTNVNSNGTLSGTGTVGSVTVNSGGTLAPGTSGSGTLSATGPVVFNAGSTFLVNVSSSSTTQFSTTGTATLAGALKIAGTNNTYTLGEKWSVLTADGGVTGTFTTAAVQSSGATFSTNVTYDATHVYLQIDLEKLTPLLPSGATTNETNVVAGIDAAIAAGNSLPSAISNLGNLTSTSLGTAADQLVGEIGADLPEAGRMLMDPFLNTIFDHSAYAQKNGRSANQIVTLAPRAWAGGVSSSRTLSADAGLGVHHFSSSGSSFAGGMEWGISPALVVGAAVSVGSGNFSLSDDLGTGDVSAVQLAGYGQYRYGRRIYGLFAGVLALDKMSTSRTITVSGSEVLTGKGTMTSFGGRYETGLRLNFASPYIALQGTMFTMPSYDEAAASGTSAFALSYQGGNRTEASLEIGARQNFDIPISTNWSVSLTDRLGLAKSVIGSSSAKAAFVGLADSEFSVEGVRPGTTAASLALGLGLRNRSGLSFDLRFNGSASGAAQTYSGSAAVGFRW